ncbi:MULTISPECIES: hypothetical protein [unclassified Pseudoxanthomonas]|uniref:hypothetical protein n=1 Tax=unclassified Pseudoxanthomonas TaxID=2645906 RepID=UPI0008EC3DE2|nr:MULTISPECIES: hypothetical protein [unclassified Pseudoxanthomonas]PPJ42332.1 hypothetical protein C0063_03315 [Pseudoxanthomonas sp. KAs_5_3]SFV27715.1 hypothetical protein SAMN05428990_0766 [Pseudoxanthomonas sp. YR558]
MDESIKRPIPSTFEMLERTKRPKIVSKFDWIENWSFIGLIVLGLLTFALWGLSSYGWMSLETAKFLLFWIIVAMVLIVVIWGASQLVEAYRAIKAGYRPMAERIDAAAANERAILDDLQECDHQELRERSKHLELEVKVLGRRAGLATITSAIAFGLINLLDTAAKASIWPELSHARLFVYTGSLGILIGSLLLVIFIGKLERIAGLYALAAERTKP